MAKSLRNFTEATGGGNIGERVKKPRRPMDGEAFLLHRHAEVWCSWFAGWFGLAWGVVASFTGNMCIFCREVVLAASWRYLVLQE